jgi:hypothetical protein
MTQDKLTVMIHTTDMEEELAPAGLMDIDFFTQKIEDHPYIIKD